MEKQHNQKYQQLVTKARELFFQFGIKRVTIEEICKKANVSKMTFYKFFRNKTEIVNDVYDVLVKQGWKEYYSIKDKEINFSEKLKLILELKSNLRKIMGNEFIQDLMECEEYKPLIQKRIKEGMDENIDFFNEGKKCGEFREDISLEFYLFQMNHLTTLIDDVNLKVLFPDISERINELTNFFFYGVANTSKEGSKE